MTRAYGTGSVRVKGTKWYGRWYDAENRRVERVLGDVRSPHSKDGLTQAMAEKALRKLMDAPVVRITERMTVVDAAERFLEHRRAGNRKPETLRSYKSLIDAKLAPLLAMPLSKLDRAAVERFQRQLSEGGWRRPGGTRAASLSPKSVRNAVSFLSSVCRYAVRQGWLPADPCIGVDLVTVPRSTEIRYLTEDEVAVLLSCIPHQRHGQTRRALYACAVWSGLRKGELLGLRWRDVDWQAGKLRVSQNYVNGIKGTPKSGKARAVSVPDKLLTTLERHFQASGFQADDDLVFCNPLTGHPRNGNRVTEQFKEDARRAGIREAWFHDLRHTYGTLLASKGVPLRTIQEWMGHADAATTQIYAAYMPSATERDTVNAVFG